MFAVRVLPKNSTQCPRSGLEPGPLNPGMGALTMRPPCLPLYSHYSVCNPKTLAESLKNVHAFIAQQKFQELQETIKDAMSLNPEQVYYSFHNKFLNKKYFANAKRVCFWFITYGWLLVWEICLSIHQESITRSDLSTSLLYIQVSIAQIKHIATSQISLKLANV